MGNTILMGRKTWDSLPKALPGRENWVLSRRDQRSEGMRFFTSLKDVAEHLPDKQTLFVIGGGEVYRQALPLCHELYIIEVHQKVPDGMPFFRSTEISLKPLRYLMKMKTFSYADGNADRTDRLNTNIKGHKTLFLVVPHPH